MIESISSNWKISKIKLIWWWIERHWNIFENFLNPKNKWLTKIIPNHYTENDKLIELVLFKILVNYVEVEKGLTYFEWTVNDNEPNYKQLIKNCYETITGTIPNIEKSLKNMKVGDTIKDCKSYMEVDDALEKLKQDTCETIVKIMGVLWT